MNHRTHMYLMVGMVAVGAVLFFTGVLGGSAFALLWPLACVAMMLAMMWAMGRASRDSQGASNHSVKPGNDLSRHH